MQEHVDAATDQRIEAAVRRANEEVLQTARATNKRGMGATLTAVFVENASAYILGVGDSRAYVLRAGTLHQLTRDQSLVQALVDAGVMSAEDARDSPQKNIILQAMGTTQDVRIGLGLLSLRRGDTFLICCDGLSNAIADDELRDLVASDDPQVACARLIALGNERGGADNLTAIVARFDGTALATTAASESVADTFQVLRVFTKEVGRPK
jgi:PPM family protein phosphatase